MIGRTAWWLASMALGCISLPAHAAVSMNADELAAALDAAPAPFVLDVRSEREFAAGRIPGAVLIPHDQLAERIDELGPPREVVVYCRSGRRVGLVREELERAGFAVRELEGSFNAWQAADLPVEQVAAE